MDSHNKSSTYLYTQWTLPQPQPNVTYTAPHQYIHENSLESKYEEMTNSKPHLLVSNIMMLLLKYQYLKTIGCFYSFMVVIHSACALNSTKICRGMKLYPCTHMPHYRILGFDLSGGSPSPLCANPFSPTPPPALQNLKQ